MRNFRYVKYLMNHMHDFIRFHMNAVTRLPASAPVSKVIILTKADDPDEIMAGKGNVSIRHRRMKHRREDNAIMNNPVDAQSSRVRRTGGPQYSAKSVLFASALCLTFALAQQTATAGYFEDGSRYYIYKNYDKARELFLKAGELNNDGNAYYFLGEIEKNAANYNGALDYYRIAITKKITRKYLNLAYWNIIILLEQKGDYDGMVQTCRELYDRLGDSGAKTKVESLINKMLWTENQQAKDEYQKGIEYKKKEAYDDAMTAFRSALQTDSSFLAPKFEIGIIELKNGNTGSATRYLGEVAEKIPYYGEVHLLLGDIYFQKGYYRDAIFHFQKSRELGFLDSGTRYLTFMKSATSYYNTGDYAQAKENLNEALAINKKSLETLLLLSAISIKQEKYDDALKSLESARKIEPDNPEILFQIGSIHYRMNNPRYAEYFDNLFDTTVSSETREAPPKYLKAFSLLAKYHYEKGQYQRTEKILTAFEGSSSTYETTLLLAKTYYRLGNDNKSIETFEKISLSSDDDRYILCQLYARNGMREKAKAILASLINNETCAKKAKNDPDLKNILNEIESEKNGVDTKN